MKSGQRNEERSWSSSGGLSLRISVPGCRATCSSWYVCFSFCFESWPSHFTLLYHTLVRDGALPLGYLQEFTSLEAPARRSANRLQASAVAVTDSAASMTLAALRRESEHRASVEKSILDQLVIAADMRPKKISARNGNVLSMMAPRLGRMLSLRSGIVGSSFWQTCSGPQTRRWES